MKILFKHIVPVVKDELTTICDYDGEVMQLHLDGDELVHICLTCHARKFWKKIPKPVG